ncbi:MAG: tRNA preQ1(34) S-adenosylmethionine ribosyltransferase-isomerase QueA [Nitrospirae bacterium]|nr:MAG: tRNA preQ1(34) S-adenosylmethionine ribosyltransferase-isomerase QueA [Nitrospirota bacterium]
MRLEDFDYPLDESLIAQQPVEPRDHARLLVVDRNTGPPAHRRFDALPGLLRRNDLLVLNNTQVIHARLQGHKRPSGGKVEVLLVRATASRNIWQALVRGGVRPGQHVELPDGVLAAVAAADGGAVLVEFPPALDVPAYVEKAGAVPLPPYIRRAPTEEDRARYQTVFARRPGAVAAPTAGLHFTEPLLDALRTHGVRTACVTLHVGPGTFTPVTCGDIRAHRMDPEWFELPADTAAAVNETRTAGGRVIAVGSTSVRVLETVARNGLPLQAATGETALFIYPGYRFAAVDAMLTNFHLPKSTLFMLVCALAGRERMLEAYRAAAAERYRFYSYGDAMLIL